MNRNSCLLDIYVTRWKYFFIFEFKCSIQICIYSFSFYLVEESVILTVLHVHSPPLGVGGTSSLSDLQQSGGHGAGGGGSSPGSSPQLFPGGNSPSGSFSNISTSSTPALVSSASFSQLQHGYQRGKDRITAPIPANVSERGFFISVIARRQKNLSLNW